jgi:hypothetical protein
VAGSSSTHTLTDQQLAALARVVETYPRIYGRVVAEVHERVDESLVRMDPEGVYSIPELVVSRLVEKHYAGGWRRFLAEDNDRPTEGHEQAAPTLQTLVSRLNGALSVIEDRLTECECAPGQACPRRLTWLWTQLGVAVALDAMTLWGISDGLLPAYLSEHGDRAWFGAGAAALLLIRVSLDSVAALWDEWGQRRLAARHPGPVVTPSVVSPARAPAELPAGLGRGGTDRVGEISLDGDR